MSEARVLPHSPQAEVHVLGGVLIQPRTLPEVLPLVDAADFYQPAHEKIFEAIVALDATHRPVNPITVAEEMRAQDTLKVLRAFNGEAYFAELTSAVVTVENIAYSARIVRGKATVRRLIEAAQEIAARGYGDYGDLDEFLAAAEGSISRVLMRRDVGSYEPMAALMRRLDRTMRDRAEANRTVTGTPSGYEQLDSMTGGEQPGHFVVLGGRPKMGKTSLAMDMVRNAALAGVPQLVFSLEMSSDQLGERATSQAGAIDATALRQGRLTLRDWQAFTRATSALAGAPIWVYGRPATFSALRSLARRWRAVDAPPERFPLARITIDYLQKISPEKRGKNFVREQEIADWSRGCKELAQELRASVLALAQLSRECEKRPDKRPQVSDLRESGALEADADLVALLYRDEVYHKNSDDKGIAELIVGAHRHGGVGTVRLAFHAESTHFTTAPEEQAPLRWDGVPLPGEEDAR